MASTDETLQLMGEIAQFSREILVDTNMGTLNLSRKKYAQLRLAGSAHALFEDITTLLEQRSARSAEMLLRALIETFVNFSWIGLGRGNRNLNLYIADDNMRFAKQLKHHIEYAKRINTEASEIDEWEKLYKLNVVQARQALNSSYLSRGATRFPKLHEKAQELDQWLGNESYAYEWLVRYPYSFAHHAVHVTNRYLNMLLNDDTGEIELRADETMVDRMAGEAISMFLGILDDYCATFGLKTNIDTYWAKAGYKGGD